MLSMNFMYHTVSYSINDVSYICISHFYKFRIKLLEHKFYLSLLVFFNVMFFQASLSFTEHRPFNWNQVETLIHRETLPRRTAAGIRQLSFPISTHRYRAPNWEIQNFSNKDLYETKDTTLPAGISNLQPIQKYQKINVEHTKAHFESVV